MVLSPSFRLLDLHEALCCLKNFRAPASSLRTTSCGRRRAVSHVSEPGHAIPRRARSGGRSQSFHRLAQPEMPLRPRQIQNICHWPRSRGMRCMMPRTLAPRSLAEPARSRPSSRWTRSLDVATCTNDSTLAAFPAYGRISVERNAAGSPVQEAGLEHPHRHRPRLRLDLAPRPAAASHHRAPARPADRGNCRARPAELSYPYS